MRVFLPVYFVTAVLLVFVLRTLWVKRRTGNNPLVERWNDDLRGYVARALAVSHALLGLSVVLFTVGGVAYEFAAPLRGLERVGIQGAGVAVLLSALVWILVAQAQMGASWRIGVDPDARTELVTQGVFAVSRNPIFLGMRACLIGVFLASPNVLALVAALLGEIAIQVQVRIEEPYLEGVHGAAYRAYRASVRRWV